MKWIPITYGVEPADKQVCYILVRYGGGDGYAVWWAQRRGDKYYGCSRPGDDEVEISGDVIAWQPKPVNPFYADDVSVIIEYKH